MGVPLDVPSTVVRIRCKFVTGKGSLGEVGKNVGVRGNYYSRVYKTPLILVVSK